MEDTIYILNTDDAPDLQLDPWLVIHRGQYCTQPDYQSALKVAGRRLHFFRADNPSIAIKIGPGAREYLAANPEIQTTV